MNQINFLMGTLKQKGLVQQGLQMQPWLNKVEPKARLIPR